MVFGNTQHGYCGSGFCTMVDTFIGVRIGIFRNSIHQLHTRLDVCWQKLNLTSAQKQTYLIVIFCQAGLAQQFGCAGLILYTDPWDYNVGEQHHTYPDSWWMPESGVQRGNVKSSASGIGDMLTPGYPAIGEYLYVCSKMRFNFNNLKNIKR